MTPPLRASQRKNLDEWLHIMDAFVKQTMTEAPFDMSTAGGWEE